MSHEITKSYVETKKIPKSNNSAGMKQKGIKVIEPLTSSESESHSLNSFCSQEEEKKHDNINDFHIEFKLNTQFLDIPQIKKKVEKKNSFRVTNKAKPLSASHATMGQRLLSMKILYSDIKKKRQDSHSKQQRSLGSKSPIFDKRSKIDKKSGCSKLEKKSVNS